MNTLILSFVLSMLGIVLATAGFVFLIVDMVHRDTKYRLVLPRWDGRFLHWLLDQNALPFSLTFDKTALNLSSQ